MNGIVTNIHPTHGITIEHSCTSTKLGSVPLHRWVHESDLKSNPTKIKSEGPRFTILQAKSQFGLLEG